MKDGWCKKEFLTNNDEPSTSTVCSFYGDIKWSKDAEGGNVSFLEVSSCHERARLHRTYEMSEEDWIEQVRNLHKHVGEYLNFLVSKLRKKSPIPGDNGYGVITEHDLD